MIQGITYCRLSREIDTKSKLFTDIVNFVKHEVDVWLRSHKSVCVQDLFGGENYHWHEKGFPISNYWDAFYDKYTDAGYSEEECEVMAKTQAGIAVGYVLKYVLLKDSRVFRQSKEFMHNVYYIV